MRGDRHIFIRGEKPIYHCVQRGERLLRWYCTDPKDIHKESGPTQFDVWKMPDRYKVGTWPTLDRHQHEDAILAAIADGHDFGVWQRITR